MGHYWLNVAIFRLVIPAIFTACVIWRPTGLSLIYLILVLFSPFASIPTAETLKKGTGSYIKACIALTLLTGLTQLTFHIVLAASSEIRSKFSENFSPLEETFRHIGLVRMNNASVFEVFYWLLPEIICPPMMIAMYFLSRRLTLDSRKTDLESTSSTQDPSRRLKRFEERNAKIINFLGRIGTYIVLASLCCVSSMNPSIEASFYFLVFLGAATWWAFDRELQRGFAVICRIVMIVVVGHILLLLSYQNQWPQEKIQYNSTWYNFTNLKINYKINYTDPRNVIFETDDTKLILNYSYALTLFWLYFVLALQSQFLFKKPIIFDDNQTRLTQKLKNLDSQITRHMSIIRRSPSQRWQSARRKARKRQSTSPSQPNERTPLMRFGSGRSGLFQDSAGSVTVQNRQNEDNIQLQSISESMQERSPGIVEQGIMAICAIFQLIINSSYLATNIIMMTWSIMYHSWTTFVFLLWALILWLAPTKRTYMMKCSPFVVMYGTILIIICYIYSMNLNNILSTSIRGVKTLEIGFPNSDELNSTHLIVKCCFMTAFWITMRQYMSEKKEAKNTSTIRDMAAPFQITVTAATSSMQTEQIEIKNKFMKDVGNIVKKLLFRFWIVVVAIMLFTSSLTSGNDHKMTVFRIIYMSLFLFFVISFQISWNIWRKMMYSFWITVIAYSIIMLILVYTYQFEEFPGYWTYINVTDKLQKDIGLERYAVKDLFVRLLTPTSFVILIVIQMHYFHKEFQEITNIDNVIPTTTAATNKRRTKDDNSIQEVSTLDVLLSEGNRRSTFFTLKQLKHMSKLERIALLKRTIDNVKSIYNYIWLLIEIHIQKIIFTSFILLCVNDVCAINCIFVITVIVSMNFRKKIQIMATNCMSVAIAILMIAQMLFQIDYIDPKQWSFNCTTEMPGENNDTIEIVKGFNITDWIGLKKAEQRMLPDLLKGYIGIIVVTTFRAIIVIRQSFYRRRRGMPLETPSVMFPNITRTDADKGIIECLKFFFNYGFYKFGLEFCLMGLVVLMGIRLDFYSVIYGFWLLALFAQKRRTATKIWPFFKFFTIFMIALQYILAVAPPTSLCIDYSWESRMKKLRDWLYLPNPEDPPDARKIICDFILLYMIVRQSIVFRIEARNVATNTSYVAGHNYSVYRDMDKANFVNPVKDYISQIHSWLDIIKRGTMMSFMWITLSMVFLAGTNRTNLFSLGYLIGAFIYLWQGSDFYLRPVKVILKSWNVLIGYTIVVIFCKTIIQGIDCVDIECLKKTCWLIQLLGFSCSPIKVLETEPMICSMPREDLGMIWDGLCFTCLIIQKRFFKSYYFFHLVDDTKAMSILASRGAELLEELQRKQIEFRENVEKAVLQKIKLKMDKIKADQKKTHGPSYREPTDHKVGMAPLARSSSADTHVSGLTPSQGYRTPVDNDSDDEEYNDERKDEDPPPLTPRATSLLQAPSPNSAILTVSLDGYLEPTRISFGSPPNSELNPRGVSSPDETFPVFSPPPYDPPPISDKSYKSRDINQHRRQSSFFGTTWNSELQTTPRQSIISFTSRSPRSHHTYSLFPQDRPLYKRQDSNTNRDAIRSGDYYMFDSLHEDDVDDDDPTDLFPDSEIEMDEEDYQRQARTIGRRMTLSELMSTLLKTDIEIATHVAMYGGTAKDALRMRRQSLPLTRKKSSMSYLSARSETKTAASDDIDLSSRRDGEQATEEVRSRSTTKKYPSDSDDHLDEITSLDDDDEVDGVEDKGTKKVPLITYLKFIIEFINSMMISVTKYLNRFSRDYRYIRKVLTKEKKILKAKPDFRMGTRLGINKIWQPISIIKERSQNSGKSSETSIHREDSDQPDAKRKESSVTVPHIRILGPSLERGLDISSSSSVVMETQTEEDQLPQLSEADQPPIIQLLASIWFGILAHSKFLCYFMIFLHQIHNASIISMPLPLMVFCWGSLTIPRPSKTFWITVIAYTEALVILKSVCQLEFNKWNEIPTDNPMSIPRILGVEKIPNYALWDLLLLLVVFFHRFMLKSMGQWTKSSAKYKVTPSRIMVGTSRSSPSNKDKEEPIQLHWENEEIPMDQRASTSKLDCDDDYKIVESDKERLVDKKNDDIINCDEKLTAAVNMTVKKYYEPLDIFFQNILNDEGKERTNVYAYMFMCDFFNFLLTIFRFSSFGTQQGDGGVTAYVAEDRIPLPFLIMLLVQFAVIVIDRALYLRKSKKGKLVFQYFLIFSIHIWMFFVLPACTQRRFITNLPPQIWYMMKCFYLLLSAYQLRLGYPTRILGNFICKNYSIINYCFFKVFMIIPFLFELRACMDWIWTDTSMTIMDWFKMEDIFASVYQLKCMRGLESDYPQERGVKKSQMSKYLVGGGLLFVILAFIWFPLLLFALGGTVGSPNIPNEVSLSIRIGAHEPIYTMAAQDPSIFAFSETDFKVLNDFYYHNNDRVAITFLDNYKASDVAVVRMSKSSQKLWNITPPDKIKLRQELESNMTMKIKVEWAVTRNTDVKESSGYTKITNDIDLKPFLPNGQRNSIRDKIAALLNDSDNTTAVNNTSIIIQHVFPKFLKVTSRIVDSVLQLYNFGYDYPDKTSLYRNISIELQSDTSKNDEKWWSIQEQCDDTIYNDTLRNIPYNDCNYIIMFLFNDRSFPKSLSFISGVGIIGLYTTAVIVISQMMRRFFSDMATKIMFEDLPYVDRILRLCLDIYLVRESKELSLEEDLFAKLIFLYRSPETLIRWSRPPEQSDQRRGDGDDGDDDDEEDNGHDDVDVDNGDDGDGKADDDNDDVIEEDRKSLPQKDRAKID